MRDLIALWFINLAMRLTSWGYTYDYLEQAKEEQQNYLRYEE